MAKKILVTGAAGFIGSFLCERLVNDGNEVLGIDNLFTGQSRNLHHLVGHPRFTFKLHDVVLPFQGEFDEIYNLACPASPVHYQNDPVQTIKTCVHGAINMLDLARHTGATILQASTSEIYGDPEVHPQTEDYWGRVNPNGIRSCYDEGKRCAETLFFDYHRQYGVRIKIARIFNTYGPRMRADDGRVVSNFVVQALRGDDLTIYGTGEQTRSFCYVSDLVSGLVKLMATDKEVTGPINLGNPVEVTMLGLAREVLALTQSQSKITFRPLPMDEPRRRCPDIGLASKQLGWEPQIELSAGLMATVRYFQTALELAAQRTEDISPVQC